MWQKIWTRHMDSFSIPYSKGRNSLTLSSSFGFRKGLVMVLIYLDHYRDQQGDPMIRSINFDLLLIVLPKKSSPKINSAKLPCASPDSRKHTSWKSPAGIIKYFTHFRIGTPAEPKSKCKGSLRLNNPPSQKGCFVLPGNANPMAGHFK